MLTVSETEIIIEVGLMTMVWQYTGGLRKVKRTEGGVCAAKGFFASSCEANVKYEGRQDMALLFSESPCVTAGTYTKNRFQAAPVIWDRKITESDMKSRVVVINSGIANACTGKKGDMACRETARIAAECLEKERGIKSDPDSILVSSTGVIGMDIPIDRIADGIEKMVPKLSESFDCANMAAKAIMTTDTVEKEEACTFEIDGKIVHIGAMAKGSGMIHPNMGTMLCFITTDVNISKDLLQKALSEDIKDTFNMISVDGDTSTNDTVLILANGQAGNTLIESEGSAYDAFREGLHFVNESISKKIAGDGEGATCLFEVRVENMDTKDNARKIAKSVVSSSLTKAAVNGHDANWGRILCAVGYSDADFDPERVDLSFESTRGTIMVAENGRGVDFDENKATDILSEGHVIARLDMKMGKEGASAYGCDLSHEYVSINADYRS